RLKEHFLTLGKLLGMKVVVVLTDGRQPIGNGIGPVLEAIDVMKVLKNEPGAPRDLREKSLMVAGELLEFVGSVQKGLGHQVAREVLDSGDAYRKMMEIIDAQGSHDIPPLPKFKQVFTAKKAGVVTEVNNKTVTKICRLAGAPVTRTAGMYLHKKYGDKVKKGETLFTAYAGSEHKLTQIASYIKKENPYVIGKNA
ncbi:thymidine phosphorylase, partial [Candidatus Woesearchaeota archaeon]|nr:thymidine phosphorylase [Candidatus Woesearchaeota archaeon]